MPIVMETEKLRKDSESGTEDDVEHDPHFEPVVTLPEVDLFTNEENEEELIKLRAKLFRFDTSNASQPEWKERGTGEVKLLEHKETHSVRVVMRRDKTLKICANHFVTPWMELKPSLGSNRAWVWTVPADFADETAKSECLAIRFANPEIAIQWKSKFEEAKCIIKEKCDLYRKNNTSVSSLSDSVSSDDSQDQSAKENKIDNIEDTKKVLPIKDINKEEEKVISKMSNLNVSK